MKNKKNTKIPVTDAVLIHAKNRAFDTVLLTQRLQNAALVAYGFISEDQFLDLAKEEYTKMADIMEAYTESYSHPYVEKVGK